VDSAVIAAFVTAGGAVLASIITTVVAINKNTRRNNARLNQLQEQQQEVSRSLGTILLEKYGLKADSAASNSEVLDTEGNSRTKRCWKGVKVKDGGMAWSHIHQRIWIGTPGGKIKSGPSLRSHSAFPKDLSLVILKKTDQECEFQLEITGGLTANDPPLDFEISTDLSKAVLMSREEVETAYHNDLFKRDYHSMDVEFPVDSLELSVIFPENFPIQLFAGVFAGRSEVLHDPEYNRVKGGFTTNSRGATFKIDGPLVGFRYFIYWTPPPRHTP